MTNHVSLLGGLMTGFAIVVPIGPMGLLCIQRTLAAGIAVGICTGLGGATVNVAYAAVVLLGLDALAPWIASGSRVLNALGGLFLLWSAFKAFRTRQFAGGVAATAAPSPLAAYGSAVAFNATNPMALVLIVALLSPIVDHAGPVRMDAAAFLAGMFVAAATWWICLSGTVGLLRARLSPAILRHVNQAAGLLLTVYGALALARSMQM